MLAGRRFSSWCLCNGNGYDMSGERPSTQEILAAARAQGPAKPRKQELASDRPADEIGREHPASQQLHERDKGVRNHLPGTGPPGASHKWFLTPLSPDDADTRQTEWKDFAKPTSERRRNFLMACVATPFGAAWTMLATSLGALFLATARFLFPNALIEPPMRFKVGPPSDYPSGSVSIEWKASHGIWIVRSDAYKGRDSIYALLATCTHLGCTPNWLEAEQKFKCPCHGTGFYVNGINFEGPAPRPLERVAIRLASDGNLEIDKSVRFREELGQWEDPASYVDGSLA